MWAWALVALVANVGMGATLFMCECAQGCVHVSDVGACVHVRASTSMPPDRDKYAKIAIKGKPKPDGVPEPKTPNRNRRPHHNTKRTQIPT